MRVLQPVRLTRAQRVRAILRGSIGGDPPQVIQLRRAGFDAAVADAVRRIRPDCVYVTTAMAAYVWSACDGVPLVLNAIDAWSLNEREVYATAGPARRALGRVLVSNVQRFEAATMRAYHATIVVSASDRDWLTRIAPDADVRVVSNGVDAEYFHPADPSGLRPADPSGLRPADPSGLPPEDPGGSGLSADPTGLVTGSRRAGTAPTLVFHGTMDYAPNVFGAQFLVESVMPIVWRTRPQVRVALVGRNPTPQVRELAGPRVDVTGALPDLRPALWDADLSILPLLTGSGVKNKLLEAAAMAKPIIATPSALGDLELVDGVHARIAGDADSLARAVLELLDDPVRAARIGHAARDLVVTRHTWENVGREIEQVCRSALGPGESSGTARFTPRAAGS